MLIKIKPLSINKAFRGRRFKTKDYLEYEKVLMLLIKNEKIPQGKLFIKYRFGFSSGGSDIDNCIKEFQDILSRKLGFNDNIIFKIEAEKETKHGIVEKVARYKCYLESALFTRGA